MTTEPSQFRALVLLAGGRISFANSLRVALAIHSVDLEHTAGGVVRRVARRPKPHALVLGLNDSTPGTIRQIRAEHETPILVIGPDLPDMDEGKIAALLDVGADGYVRNSDDALELTARICALLRRTRPIFPWQVAHLLSQPYRARA